MPVGARRARRARASHLRAFRRKIRSRAADFRVNNAFGRQRLGPQARHFPAHAHARLSAFRADASWRVRSSTSSGNIQTRVARSGQACPARPARCACRAWRPSARGEKSISSHGGRLRHARARSNARHRCRGPRVDRNVSSTRCESVHVRSRLDDVATGAAARASNQSGVFPAAAQRSVQASGACQPRGDTPKTFAV